MLKTILYLILGFLLAPFRVILDPNSLPEHFGIKKGNLIIVRNHPTKSVQLLLSVTELLSDAKARPFMFFVQPTGFKGYKCVPHTFMIGDMTNSAHSIYILPWVFNSITLRRFINRANKDFGLWPFKCWIDPYFRNPRSPFRSLTEGQVTYLLKDQVVIAHGWQLPARIRLKTLD